MSLTRPHSIRARTADAAVFVGFGVEGGDEREDVPFKGVEPPLEHVDGGAPDGVGALGEPAADGGGAQGDGDGRDGHLGGEGEKGDATHILRRVARSLDDVGDGEVGDGEGAEDGLAHVLVLLGAEQGDERGGDDVVAEVAVLAAVLESAQRPRSLRANHGNLIPQAVEHHLLHALVEVVGDQLDAEGVQDTRDELAHAEPDGPVLGGGEVEEEPEKVLANSSASSSVPGDLDAVKWTRIEPRARRRGPSVDDGWGFKRASGVRWDHGVANQARYARDRSMGRAIRVGDLGPPGKKNTEIPTPRELVSTGPHPSGEVAVHRVRALTLYSRSTGRMQLHSSGRNVSGAACRTLVICLTSLRWTVSEICASLRICPTVGSCFAGMASRVSDQRRRRVAQDAVRGMRRSRGRSVGV